MNFKRSVSVFTLGCKTNHYESEQIVELLRKADYEANEGLKKADIFVINTCAVTKEAESKSRQAITRARKLNPFCLVAVIGCAVQKNSCQFADKEGVVVLCTNEDKYSVVEKITSYLKENGLALSCNAHPDRQQIEKSVKQKGSAKDSNCDRDSDSDKKCDSPIITAFDDNSDSQNITAFDNKSDSDIKTVCDKNSDSGKEKGKKDNKGSLRTRAYIKIQDGCNNFCSYCIVPYLRGRSRSRLVEQVAQEVAEKQNFAEIVLIGIDISQYGLDNGQSLTDLAKSLSFYNGRIRLGSLYCDCIDEDFCQAIEKNFCKHFHLSMQSGCDKTLKSMNRHYDCKQFEKAVKTIRTFYPNAAITTDIIVSFAGESEEDFLQTLAFVEKIAFSDIHVFPYSRREGTAAYNLPVPDASQTEKRVKLMGELKQKLKKNFIDKQIEIGFAQVLVEEYKGGYSVGYTDNYVKVYVKEKLSVNKIYDVKLLAPLLNGIEGQLIKNNTAK